jgi:hypothetical protein
MYGVKFSKTGVIEERNKFATLEEAKSAARSLANWNLENDVVDLDTNEVMQHFSPYNAIFTHKASA